MINQIKPLFLAALICSLAVQNGCSQSLSPDASTVSEAERLIPLAYDVDVIVVGGTVRGVAAAEAAAKAGAKVFLITDRPYLGQDMCATYRLWLEPGEQPVTDLGRAIFSGAAAHPDPNTETALPFTYSASLESARKYPDNGRKLADGEFSVAKKASVEYRGDVTITADLG